MPGEPKRVQPSRDRDRKKDVASYGACGSFLAPRFVTGRGRRRHDRADVAVGRLVEVDDHGRVVARPAALARVAVDPRGLDAVGHRPAREDEVDPHAEVLVEHAGAVVPVGEDALVGPAIADDVMQAQRRELGERLALRRGHMRLADVRVRVEDVLVGRRDVHVAGDDGVLGPGRHDVAKSAKPVELVGVMVRAGLRDRSERRPR